MKKIVMLALMTFFGCETAEKKKSSDDRTDKTNEALQKVEDDKAAVGHDMRGHMTTLSNNPYLGRNVNRSNALTFAEKLTSQLRDGSPPLLFAYVSANRLGNGSFGRSIGAVRTMLDQIVKKGGVQRDIPPTVELELALHALEQNRLAFAEHILDKLKKSPNKKVKADALNLGGVIALRQDRIPEAVDFFRSALKEDGQAVSARLNLGFLALRGGDYETGKQLLEGLQSDWVAASGMILVHRLSGDADAAEKACEKVLADKPTHKPTLFNCGLHYFQSRKNYKQARDYMTKVMKLAGGPMEWNERATEIISKIDYEESKQPKPQEGAKP